MNNNFEKDLADGQKGEKAVRHFVETVMHKTFVKFNDDSAYDILFQNPYEEPVTFEVKTDYWEKNIDEGGSGNIVIEYKCRGKPSGIGVTKAKYFVYYLVNVSDKHIWIIETEKLKKLIEDSKFPKKRVGETNYDNEKKTSWCWMLPRFGLIEHFDVYTFDGERWLKE